MDGYVQQKVKAYEAEIQRYQRQLDIFLSPDYNRPYWLSIAQIIFKVNAHIWPTT